MFKPNISIVEIFKWLASRVAVIYLILFIFSLTCVDLKTLGDRIKVRRLNQAVPNFEDMIDLSMGKLELQKVNLRRSKHYFELILRYLPNDFIAKQLLGYVDYYTGQEAESIVMFKSSAEINGRLLLWSNYNLGVIYYKKGMWSQAAEYLFKAISLNPQLTVLMMKNSIVYKQIFANPAFTYDMDDEINNAKCNAYILLLASLHNLGQYEKMIIIANMAIADGKLTHKDAFYYYAGLAFYETGQTQKAFLFFQKTLTMEKSNPDVYYYIASIYQLAGQQESARQYLQVSYALHQKNDPRFPYDKPVNLRFF